jgi:hypothetical protein
LLSVSISGENSSVVANDKMVQCTDAMHACWWIEPTRPKKLHTSLPSFRLYQFTFSLTFYRSFHFSFLFWLLFAFITFIIAGNIQVIQ